MLLVMQVINLTDMSHSAARDASAKILEKRDLLEPGGLEVNDRLMSEMRRRLVMMRVSLFCRIRVVLMF